MTRTVFITIFFLFGSIVTLGQQQTQLTDGTAELTSWVAAGQRSKTADAALFTPEGRRVSMFDLADLKVGCDSALCIQYGSRIGDHWDLFQVDGGRVNRTRMVDAGEHLWTDNFVVPRVDPWPPLAPGETRTVTINTSGGNGANGSAGVDGEMYGIARMRGDGTFEPIAQKTDDYAHAAVSKQVGSTVVKEGAAVRNDGYTPVVEAKLGHIYVAHVFDAKRDQYLLIRVDKLERGERAVISYKKLDILKPIF